MRATAHRASRLTAAWTLAVAVLAGCADSTGAPDPGTPDSPGTPGTPGTGGMVLQLDVTAEGPTVPAAVTFALGDRTEQSAGLRSVTFRDVAAGSYQLSVRGLTPGCTVIGRPVRDISFGSVGGDVLVEAANGWYRTSIRGSGLRAVVDISCANGAPRDLAFTAATEAGAGRDVILAAASGAPLRNLSNGAAITVSRPAWAPRGDSLAFFAADEATYSLMVSAADGSGRHTVATGHNSGYLTPPDDLHWLRDGRTLVFWSAADASLHTVQLDAGGETTVPLRRGVLSPDGARYAWIDAELHVTVLATGATVLVGPAYGIPAWSPDGTRIAFGTGQPASCQAGDILAASADGGNVVNLTSTPGIHEYGPVWAPDGSRVAFGFWSGCPSSQPIVHLGVVAPGTAPVDVVTGAVLGSRFAWSPDGTRLAYVGAIGQGCGREVGCLYEDLYIADLATPGSRRVTHGIFADFPEWNPSP